MTGEPDIAHSRLTTRSRQPDPTRELIETQDSATPVKHIGVIGGGIAGLTAAYRLAKAGHRVTLWEREPRLGGQAAAFPVAGTVPGALLPSPLPERPRDRRADRGARASATTCLAAVERRLLRRWQDLAAQRRERSAQARFHPAPRSHPARAGHRLPAAGRRTGASSSVSPPTTGCSEALGQRAYERTLGSQLRGQVRALLRSGRDGLVLEQDLPADHLAPVSARSGEARLHPGQLQRPDRRAGGRSAPRAPAPTSAPGIGPPSSRPARRRHVGRPVRRRRAAGARATRSSRPCPRRSSPGWCPTLPDDYRAKLDGSDLRSGDRRASSSSTARCPTSTGSTSPTRTALHRA